MKRNKELLEKRRELKEYIRANIEHTPMALLLHSPTFLMRSCIGHSVNLSITGNMLLLGVIVTLPTLLTILFLDEFHVLKPWEWLGIFVVLEGFCVSACMAYFNVNRLLRELHDFVVDAMVSVSDLSDLQQWLALGWTPKILRRYLLIWLVSLIPIATLNMYFVFGTSQSVGLYVWILTFLMLSGVSWSYAPLNMILSVRLSGYQYALHEIDPAHSEVISRISSCLNFYAYGYAVNAAVVQLIFAAVNQFYLFGIAAAFIAWIPLIVQFILNQMSMRRIIVNAKWKTLHGIQAQLRELHNNDIKDRNNIEVLMRLMDYHDRIRGTPNSALDLRALMNLSNQLAIPSLGFIIANIEKIMGFFR